MKKEVNTMMRNAWDFQESYYRCKMPIKSSRFNNPKVLFIAAMANISLSCEIYLKTLYFIENKQKLQIKGKKGHKLDSIFNMLSQSLKDNIIKKTGYLEETFYKELNNNNNNFYLWRYYHEWAPDSHEISYSFLEIFCDSLYIICGNLAKKIK